MADGKLVFLRPASGSGKLVFGDTGGAVVVPPAELSVDCGIAGEGAAALVLRTGPALHIDAGVAGEGACSIALRWDANVSRVTRAGLRSHWQESAPVASSLRSAWQDSDSISVGHIARWQPARPLHTAVRTHWQATTPYRGALLSRWEQGTVARRALQSGWQETTPRRAAVIARWQQAAPARNALRQHWQETTRLRNVLRSHWQDALPIRGRFQTSFTTGAPIHVRLRSHWQEARKPPPGRWAPPPIRPPCYDPARLGLLVFDTAFSGSGKLVFVCHRAGPDPEPGGTIVVRAREVYRMLNTIALRRVDTGELLPTLDGFSMALDRDSYTWSFAVSLLASALPRVRPGPDRLPVELEFMVNGQPYRMLARHWRRSTVFPASVVTISGGSPNVLLAAPYAPLQSFTQASMRTARQLAEDVLTANGVSMGWALDWQIADWPIPAGTWLHRGTWMTAVNDIASAVRGYVQPHNTDRTLRVLPDFPHAMWDWDSVTPDIELPNGVATVEEVEYDPRADYNAVYMRGEPGNYLYHRYRPGTAGDLVAATVVHPLLVHADAAAQRAIAELSDTGAQLPQSLTLPILPETGIIKPGLYVGYTDDAGERRVGLVRRTQVSEAGEAAVQQTIGVLTYE